MEKDLIEQAREYAMKAHEGQKDDNGIPFFFHVNHVASIIRTAGGSDEMIAAAYLHDTIEDCSKSYDNIEIAFGKEVADLVYEVTHEGSKDQYGYYFPRLKTRDGIVLKLADRMSNLLRMDCWPEKRRKQYLRKTKFWKSGHSK